MEKIVNECVGCPPELGCLGNSCPNRNILVHECDKCHEYIEEEVFEVDGEEVCEDCLKKMFFKLKY